MFEHYEMKIKVTLWIEPNTRRALELGFMVVLCKCLNISILTSTHSEVCSRDRISCLLLAPRPPNAPTKCSRPMSHEVQCAKETQKEQWCWKINLRSFIPPNCGSVVASLMARREPKGESFEWLNELYEVFMDIRRGCRKVMG